MVLIARVSGLCNVRRNTGAGIKASATGKSADKASVDGNLEDAAEVEKPFLVAGVADAAAYEDRDEESFGEAARGGVGGKVGSGEGIAVHFADSGKSGEVDLFADKLRERENFVEVAGAADEILVADQFVEAVGAEASDAAEKIDGRTRGRVAKGGSSLGGEKERAARRDWLKVLDEKLERRIGVSGDGRGVEPLVAGFEINAARGDHGFVGVVEDVARVEGADAAVGGGEVGSAEAQGVVQIADAIADADFVEAAGGIAYVDAGEDVIQAIDRAGVGIFVDLEIGLGGGDVGSEKPEAEGPEGAVEFGGDAVGGAEFQVGAPFGTIAPDVHRGEAGGHGEMVVLRGAANYFDVKQ